MAKWFFLICISASMLFSACQSAGDQPAKADNNTEVQDPEAYTTVQWLDSVLDKGAITEGEKIEILYRFKNTGDHPLIIKDVRPSCGCTVAEKPLEPIVPGKEGSIKALFNSQNKPGPNHKTITVISNTRPEAYQLIFNVIVNKKS